MIQYLKVGPLPPELVERPTDLGQARPPRVRPEQEADDRGRRQPGEQPEERTGRGGRLEDHQRDGAHAHHPPSDRAERSGEVRGGAPRDASAPPPRPGAGRIAVAPTATTDASAIPDARSCSREAPRHRSNAVSRTRAANTTAKVVAITSAATATANTVNASRARA